MGEERRFQVCSKDNRVLVDRTLPALSYCTMEGWFQRDYLHAIPPDPSATGARINVTWRWIVDPHEDAAL